MLRGEFVILLLVLRRRMLSDVLQQLFSTYFIPSIEYADNLKNVILNYVEALYKLEQQKVLVDGLLCDIAQAYLPVGLRCEVWHERFMNYTKGTRRLIGILSEEGTIGDTVLQDETNLQNAIEKLLQNKDVRHYIKEKGLLLSDS